MVVIVAIVVASSISGWIGKEVVQSNMKRMKKERRRSQLSESRHSTISKRTSSTTTSDSDREEESNTRPSSRGTDNGDAEQIDQLSSSQRQGDWRSQWQDQVKEEKLKRLSMIEQELLQSDQ